MASMKKTFSANPITGEEAGKVILGDLTQWAKNVRHGRDPQTGRKTRQELMEMLDGLQSREEAATYSDYRALQELLHTKFTYSDSMIQEIMSTWHAYMRELDLLTLSIDHDDPILEEYKPDRYLKWQRLHGLRAEFMITAKRNSGYMAFLNFFSSYLCLDLNVLGDELNIQNFRQAQERVDDLKARLEKSELPGAPELLEIVSKLAPIVMRPPVAPETMRKVKAIMRHKRPLNQRVSDIYDLMVYGRIM